MTALSRPAAGLADEPSRPEPRAAAKRKAPGTRLRFVGWLGVSARHGDLVRVLARKAA